MAYFEFIPVEREDEEVVGECNGGDVERPVEVVDLVDVEVGKYYELVVTTFTGELANLSVLLIDHLFLDLYTTRLHCLYMALHATIFCCQILWPMSLC